MNLPATVLSLSVTVMEKYVLHAFRNVLGGFRTRGCHLQTSFVTLRHPHLYEAPSARHPRAPPVIS